MFLASLLLIALNFWWTRVSGLSNVTAILTTSETITSYFYTEKTETVTRQTPCFVTSGTVSLCGRRRGIEEEPEYYFHQDFQEERFARPSGITT